MPDWIKNDPDAALDDAAPSKSERKRQMHALQALGESLLSLNDKQLAEIPIEDEQLLLAIQECHLITSNSARKRHLQLIGKLMRNIDPAPLEKALSAMHQGQRESTVVFHELEQLREDILAAGAAGVELAIARWPDADRQQLRQLVLQHQREIDRNKPPTASRKLFRYLRELQEVYGDAGSS
jgi:ribosome-associated protein